MNVDKAKAKVQFDIEQKSQRNMDIPPDNKEIVILDEYTMTKPYGWVFFFDSKKHRETGDFNDTLIGRGPVVFILENQEIHYLGSAFPAEKSVPDFEQRYFGKIF